MELVFRLRFSLILILKQALLLTEQFCSLIYWLMITIFVIVATGYTERSYFVSVGARTTTNVNLYLLNDTQAVNVTTFVFDYYW